jgi:hypothetical protein
MHLKQIMLVGVAVLLIFTGCRQSREIPARATQSQCHWKIQKPTTESSDRYFDGTMPAECFPGLSEFQHNIVTFEAKVFNRWGMVMFETKSMDENWICNRGEANSIPAGSYFFLIRYQEARGSAVVEKTGVIVLTCD